jgi:uncharacterized repeat protein (TIGR03803 family)
MTHFARVSSNLKVKGAPMTGFLAVTRKSILFGGLALAIASPPGTAHAAKIHVLYAFQGGNDGASPFGAVIRKDGVRYGTTYYGGTDDLGTVFRLDGDGIESVLHSFTGGSDGASPQTGLIADATGNLYGTTSAAGAGNCGTVFKVTPKGDESVLYAFQCGVDGSSPTGGVVSDAAGNLYGTTYAGGTSGLGTIFKIATDGTKTVFYAFKGGSDGADPSAGLIIDKKGNLYGTTYAGGTVGLGTVFKITPNGTETMLHAFTGGSDGATPFASVTRDGSGNLYGTTYTGGGGGCNGNGCGTVFRVARNGTETVLYSFAGGTDGTGPYGGLVLDANGNLYGTTLYGGSTNCNGNGCGMIFRIAPDGTKTMLYAFSGSDGARPSANLTTDKKGHLYGTTFDGGGSGCGGSGCGVVFKVRE